MQFVRVQVQGRCGSHAAGKSGATIDLTRVTAARVQCLPEESL